MTVAFPKFLELLDRTAGDLPAWKTLAPGYLTIRLIEPDHAAPDFVHAFHKARAAALELIRQAPPSVEVMLLELFEAIPSDGSETSVVLGPLMTYAKWLHEQGQYDVAAEVYETAERVVIRMDTALRQPLAAATLYLDTAASAMAAEQWPRARVYLDAARQYADTLPRRSPFALRVRIWGGVLEGGEGKLDTAEQTLSEVILDARASGRFPEEHRALLERARIVQRREAWDHALTDICAAYAAAGTDDEREVSLQTLAQHMGNRGYRQFAHCIYGMLATSRQAERASAAQARLGEADLEAAPVVTTEPSRTNAFASQLHIILSAFDGICRARAAAL